MSKADCSQRSHPSRLLTTVTPK
uniref:Uncharacterized protein n=1 Tax=Arundo donax TaxID=35708 RepID=A0A0A9BC21_ARUDO